MREHRFCPVRGRPVAPRARQFPFRLYRQSVEKPLRAFLAAHPAIDFIVLTKGIPIRIANAPGRGLGNRRPSLDSYLAALDYEKMPGAVNVHLADSGFIGTAWANRFWNSPAPFRHAKFGGYLVTRLDGYTEADAKGLVTRAGGPGAGGPPGAGGTCYWTPARRSVTPTADASPRRSSTGRRRRARSQAIASSTITSTTPTCRRGRDPAIAARAGRPTQTDAFAGKRAGLMGYVSWGSNDRHYDAVAYHSLRFASGAVAETAVSTSARTFLPTTGGQSLIADLVAQGVTGVKGYTDEPLLQAVASPSVLFDRYTRGWTLAEISTRPPASSAGRTS